MDISEIQTGILSTVGNTPLVRLNRIFEHTPLNAYAKLESFNPGGSMKDRPALYMIKGAIEQGLIGSGTTVVESSSGNMGIGLAQICSYFDVPFICVVDPITPKQTIRIMEAYGAQIAYVNQPDPVKGSFLQARLDRVHELLDSGDDMYWPCQYANEYNPAAHFETTMAEISRDLPNIDYLFCPVSTCGTIGGCINYIIQHQLNTRVIAVDAVGSVNFGGQKGDRIIPGHGASVLPSLEAELEQKIFQCIRVTDLECAVGCRMLLKKEAIFAGGSSGGVIISAMKFAETLLSNQKVNSALILPDRGERYLDTIYSDAWLHDNFGDVAYHWNQAEATFSETLSVT